MGLFKQFWRYKLFKIDSHKNNNSIFCRANKDCEKHQGSAKAMVTNLIF